MPNPYDEVSIGDDAAYWIHGFPPIWTPVATGNYLLQKVFSFFAVVVKNVKHRKSSSVLLQCDFNI